MTGGRRIGRWPLAIVCGVVGFAFTARPGRRRLGHLQRPQPRPARACTSGKGIGFDFVHAAGCLVFALAFGPALIRSLQRFRDAAAGHVACRPERRRRCSRRRRWSRWPDGGARQRGRGDRRAAARRPAICSRRRTPTAASAPRPGRPRRRSTPAGPRSGWPPPASNPQDVARGGHEPDRLHRARRRHRRPTSASLERNDPRCRAPPGCRPRASADATWSPTLRADIRRQRVGRRTRSNLTSFAVLALRAAGVARRRRDAARGSCASRTPTAASTSRRAGGHERRRRHRRGARGARRRRRRGAAQRPRRAVAYIRRQQDRDGGFPGQPGAGSNAQSTAWAVQGLIAAGVNPGALHRGGAPSPLAYLRSLIAADGHVRYSRGSDQTPVWVTGEALMALEGKPLPLAAPVAPDAATPAPELATHRVARPAPRGPAGRASARRGAPASTHSPAAGPAVGPQRRRRSASAGRIAARRRHAGDR